MYKSDENMTLAQVAAEVRVTPDTIWRAVRSGLLKGHLIGTRRWIVSRADYEDWRARGAPTTLPKGAPDGTPS